MTVFQRINFEDYLGVTPTVPGKETKTSDRETGL